MDRAASLSAGTIGRAAWNPNDTDESLFNKFDLAGRPL